jgi:hypothetical protein
MPLSEILQNSAPAIGGLFVTVATFAYVHKLRRERARRLKGFRPAAHQAAE